MKKISVAEKHFLNQLISISESLSSGSKQATPGFLIALIRKRLMMSQQALAKRTKLPQPMLSKIESGKVVPTINTLKKIFDALFCDIALVPLPRKNFDTILQDQAKKVAKRRVGYLRGTMALEKQDPKNLMIQELIKEEESFLLNEKPAKIWTE